MVKNNDIQLVQGTTDDVDNFKDANPNYVLLFNSVTRDQVNTINRAVAFFCPPQKKPICFKIPKNAFLTMLTDDIVNLQTWINANPNNTIVSFSAYWYGAANVYFTLLYV